MDMLFQAIVVATTVHARHAFVYVYLEVDAVFYTHK